MKTVRRDYSIQQYICWNEKVELNQAIRRGWKNQRISEKYWNQKSWRLVTQGIEKDQERKRKRSI